MKPWTKETPRDYSRRFGWRRVAEVYTVDLDDERWPWRLGTLSDNNVSIHLKKNARGMATHGECATAATAKASAMRAAKRLGWMK